MKLWGLTGGIGSGKSTVGKMFTALGANVINADDVYHGLLEPEADGPSALTQQIVAAFEMPSLLRPDHTLDRPRLGELVFHDAAARQKLEAITHPVIRATTENMLRRIGNGHVMYDVPLLFEKHMERSFAGVIVVWVPGDTQLQRLIQRDQLSEEAALARVAAQLPLDEKRNRADLVIDNSGDLEHTRSCVAEAWAQMAQV